MLTFARVLLAAVLSLFKSRSRLQGENLVLRHQLNVLRRSTPKRARLTGIDRFLLVWLYRLCTDALQAIVILRPETIVRWHRTGFHAYWRWKSCGRTGRPTLAKDVRDLIREISLANPLWGAPRIHGELQKLGFEVAQSSVSKYMAKRRPRPGQNWLTFLHNHADGITAIDLFVAAQQRVALAGAEVEYLFGEDEVLVEARHLVNGQSALWERPRPMVRYYSLLLDGAAVIDAAGCRMECASPSNHEPALGQLQPSGPGGVAAANPAAPTALSRPQPGRDQ